MAEAGPYGITQFDAPGIIGAYQTAQRNRVQMMYEQKQLEKMDAESKRTAAAATAWSKVIAPSSGSKAVDAYGTTPTSAPASTPATPADPLAPLPDAKPAPAAAPAGPTDSPLGQINQQAVPELLSALGPEAGTQFLEHWQQLDDAKKKAVADHNKEIGQAIAWADTPEKWDQAVDTLSAQNPQLAKYKGHFDQRGQAALQVGAISSFVDASKPDLMTVGAGQSVIDKAHPELGPSYTAPADYEHFTVTNADGTTTPYGFDKKTGKTFQLQDAGGPETGSGGPSAHTGGAVALDGNNPGGINDGSFAKSQPGYKGANGRFASFDTLQNGINAQSALLKSYVSRGYDTPSKIAQRWAPAKDGNDPTAYAANIAKAMGIGPNDKITAANLGAFQHAQAMQENSMYGQRSSQSSGAGTPISGKPLSNDPDTGDTAKFIGGQVALGQPMPPLGMGKQAAAMRQAILAEATKQWKAMGISPGEANVIAAENKSGLAELGKIAQMKAQVQTAENTASANATQVLSLLGSAGSTGSPIFNAWQQAGRRATGDSKVSAFDVAVKTLSTEYARVMSGGNSQQLSDTARHEADALIHTSMTPDQFRATIKQMKIDMANRTQGIEDERQRTLAQIRSGGRAAPTGENWITLPSGLKIRKVQ